VGISGGSDQRCPAIEPVAHETNALARRISGKWSSQKQRGHHFTGQHEAVSFCSFLQFAARPDARNELERRGQEASVKAVSAANPVAFVRFSNTN
jgi:hypothetical protein